ncbi:MAG: queuosine precursor transporter, partial [Phycisphaerales bacterium]|nr:queuosine precursor transporter [Phycisphaerales bacterium]
LSAVEYVAKQAGRPTVFFEVRALAFGATIASMLAYLLAQFTDVWMFHFWKKLTRGRHLWLRNNGSTLVSQLFDTVAVILITAWLGVFDSGLDYQANPMIFLLQLIVTGYAFKFICALADTLPLYWLVPRLARWLEIDPIAEHRHLDDPGSDSYR